LYDIKARLRKNPFGLLYQLDKCFSDLFFIHRTLHQGKIYPVKIIQISSKIGELIFLFIFYCFNLHAPLTLYEPLLVHTRKKTCHVEKHLYKLISHNYWYISDANELGRICFIFACNNLIILRKNGARIWRFWLCSRHPING